MGPPLFVIPGTKVSRHDRLDRQLDHLGRMLEETPLIELHVSQASSGNPTPTWYELSGYYLGLRMLLTEAERDAAWGDVKSFRQGRLKEEKLSDLSKFLHAFNEFMKVNKRRWSRETGADVARWEKIKADPEKLKRRRQLNAEVQRRRRQVKRDLNAAKGRTDVDYAEAAE